MSKKLCFDYNGQTKMFLDENLHIRNDIIIGERSVSDSFETLESIVQYDTLTMNTYIANQQGDLYVGNPYNTIPQNIYIGSANDNIFINGTVTSIATENLAVEDTCVTLNKNGTTFINSGIEIESKVEVDEDVYEQQIVGYIRLNANGKFIIKNVNDPTDYDISDIYDRLAIAQTSITSCETTNTLQGQSITSLQSTKQDVITNSTNVTLGRITGTVTGLFANGLWIRGTLPTTTPDATNYPNTTQAIAIGVASSVATIKLNAGANARYGKIEFYTNCSLDSDNFGTTNQNLTISNPYRIFFRITSLPIPVMMTISTTGVTFGNGATTIGLGASTNSGIKVSGILPYTGSCDVELHACGNNGIYFKTNIDATVGFNGVTRMQVRQDGNVIISNLTANRVIITNASNHIASSAVTDTELGYLSGVTSSIQTQLNSKNATLTFDNTPTNGSNNPVTSQGIYSQLLLKQDLLYYDSLPTSGSNNSVTSGTIYTALATKQATLTYDGVPTSGSSNSLTSGTVYTALAAKQATLTYDGVPTSGSSNSVTSGTVYTALAAKQATLTYDGVPTSGSSNSVTSGTVYTALTAKQDLLTSSSTLLNVGQTTITNQSPLVINSTNELGLYSAITLNVTATNQNFSSDYGKNGLIRFNTTGDHNIISSVQSGNQTITVKSGGDIVTNGNITVNNYTPMAVNSTHPLGLESGIVVTPSATHQNYSGDYVKNGLLRFNTTGDWNLLTGINNGTQNLVLKSSGAITCTQVNCGTSVNCSVIVGTITMYSGSSAPLGYLLCNGQSVSRTTYASLFAICGTAYGGGDGSTTFNVPNMINRFPLGGSTGTYNGSEYITTSNLPNHSHTYERPFGSETVSKGVAGATSEAVRDNVNQIADTSSIGDGVAYWQPYCSVNFIIKY